MTAIPKGLAATVAGRILMIGLLLSLGLGGMVMLIMLRKPPAQAENAERAVPVEILAVQPEDVAVTITGYGEIRARDVVAIAPEVGGKVVEIHPKLEVGSVIPKGELLFRVDPRDYAAGQAQAEAQTAQLKTSLDRLKKQYASDRERVQTLQRTVALARAEYDRLKDLYETSDVGAQTGVDRAEMAVNQSVDGLDQLEQAVSLYPDRISEMESALTAAEAQRDIASLNIERTVVYAMFDARIKQVQLEQGQYVRPGEPVLTLADDALLEIAVPVDSRDARSWLDFQENNANQGGAWFEALKSVPCSIAWTEDLGSHVWEGYLDRVLRVEQQTRTVTVAVRVPGAMAVSKEGGIPLVEGMFCQVTIPGKTMHGVYRLPRWAVGFDGVVYVAEDNRLQPRTVEVERTQGESTLVSGGLSPGDLVIVTRLVNPLPNTLLAVEPMNQGDTAS